jgi:oligoendopeptidase F
LILESGHIIMKNDNALNSPGLVLAAHAASSSAGSALGDLPEWNLTHLYPDMNSALFQADLERANRLCAAFAQRWRGKLAEIAAGTDATTKLATAVREYEEIEDLLGRIMSYAGLVHAGDTTDPVRAKFYGDAQDKITTASSDLLFFALELNRIDDAVIETAMSAEPLAHYRPWIEDIRKEKPHQLEDRIEQLFHEKSVTAYSAWNRLFDETIAGLRFKVDGREITLVETLNMLQDNDGDNRKAAAIALGETLKSRLPTFALITNTLAKDKEISDRWRGFSDVADSRHLANRVEREVVDALASAVEAAYPRLSHRFYKWKAKQFGRDVLDYWDRNAPLPDSDTRIYRWEEARDLVLEAYGAFAPPMADIANRFFREGWIDAPVRPGKSPGAFAHPTVPSAHPYVLVNFMGKSRDVMTLAHELGHGVHQVMSARNGALMAPAPLTLAETASVFGEMLTFRKMLDEAKDKRERRALLAAKVSDMLNTVVRQIAFYSFERKLHLARRESELTPDQINDIWMSVQGDSFGPSIRLGPGYETWWAYIPHFVHSPFYVYAYAFGDCLVNSLYGVYRNAAPGFVDKYFALLSAGGTKHHSELLAPFGLDARDPAFWQIGLGMIEDFITELESLDA